MVRSVFLGIVFVLCGAPAAFADATLSTPVKGLVKPVDVAAGDVDGDGHDDLVIAGDTLTVERNLGGGKFAPSTLPTSGAPDHVALGDVDGDGRTDVVSLASADRAVDLQLAGGLVTLDDVGVSPNDLAVGDLDGDGTDEIVVSDGGADADHVQVFSHDDDGYVRTTLNDAGGAAPVAVAIGDADGDGLVDIATANGGTGAKVSLYHREANGSFTPSTLTYTYGDSVFDVAIAAKRPAITLLVRSDTLSPVGQLVQRPGRAGLGQYGSYPYAVAVASQPSPEYRAMAFFSLGSAQALAAAGDGAAPNLAVATDDGKELAVPIPEVAKAIAAGDFDGDGRGDIAALEAARGEIVLATRIAPIARPTITIGDSVPTVLDLTLGPSASFGTFLPGVANDYVASTTAVMTSSAGDAALTVSVPGPLANGTQRLRSPLVVEPTPSTWTAPVAVGKVAITFRQHVDADEPLHTGTYSQHVTFTLAATTP